MSNGVGPISLDVYGFILDCTAEEQRSRDECDRSQAQQVQVWEKYWKRKKMPKPDKLKKLCRKVRHLARHLTNPTALLIELQAPLPDSPTAKMGGPETYASTQRHPMCYQILILSPMDTREES